MTSWQMYEAGRPQLEERITVPVQPFYGVDDQRDHEAFVCHLWCLLSTVEDMQLAILLVLL